jgi:TolB-like protein/Flp pilus assembly protein TadD
LGALLGVLIYYNQGVKSNTDSNLESKSVAVLPFKQIDKEKDEKLGVGIADVLIARLANIEDVSVRPTTSIIRFADADNSNLFDIGKKLDVKYVIAGTIQKQNNIVRITTQLFSVLDKKQIWNEKFDEEYTDIFTLQDKISERIAQKLLINFNKNQSSLPYKQYTKSAEAYQAYSMGLSYWSMHSKSGFEKAIGQFEKAIQKDPEFANAYAYLADTFGHTGHLREVIEPKIARDKGLRAAQKALQLDPQNAEAMAAMALIYANENKQKEAFDLMKKAVELKPNDAHIRHRISWMYANKGSIEKAVEQMKIAQSLDPQSAYINIFYAEILLLARQPEEAIKFFDKALQIEPDSISARWRLIEANEQKGDFEMAEQELNKLFKRFGENEAYLLVKSRLYAHTQKETQAREILKSFQDKKYNAEYDELIAYTEIALGEEGKAMQRIKPIIDSIQDNIYRVKFDYKLDPIRDNPDFKNILAKKEKDQGW